MSSSNSCFLTCIHISQEAGQVLWYFHLFQNFPQFIVIHTVKGFGIVNKAEIDVFLELSCFFGDPADVGNLISDSSEFSKEVTWSRSVMSDSLTPWTVAHQAPPSMRFSRENTGVSCHFILHGIFLTQESNPGFLLCRQTLYHLRYQGTSLILVLVKTHPCILRCFSRIWLFVTLWTVAHQSPLCMGFCRQEYWSGLPFPPPGIFLTQGLILHPMPPALASGFFTTSTTCEAQVKPWNVQMTHYFHCN